MNLAYVRDGVVHSSKSRYMRLSEWHQAWHRQVLTHWDCDWTINWWQVEGLKEWMGE